MMCFRISKNIPNLLTIVFSFLSTEFMISVMHGIEYCKDGIYIFTGNYREGSGRGSGISAADCKGL